jgi:hypothetical protein
MQSPLSAENQVRMCDGYHWLPQTCPICEVPPETFIGRRGGEAHRTGLGVVCEIWQCNYCGLIFANPMPVPVGGVEQHYAIDAQRYFQQYDEEKKAEGARLMLTLAEKFTGGKGRLLDIGAGRGELLFAGKTSGWEVIGIEPSSTFAEYATRLSGADVRHEPLEHCGFGDESFDVVFLSGVLEHLYNPAETMREITRVLRPGGALYVDVPNEAGLYFRLGNLYQKLRGRDWCVNLAPTFEPFHVFGFGPRSLRQLLKKCGLGVRDWRIYAGKSLVPDGGGLGGGLEQLGARAVTAISRFGEMGAYIETWAVKARNLNKGDEEN